MANRAPIRTRSTRQFVWSNIISSLITTSLGTGKAVGTSIGVASGGGVTLIRTRGNLSLHLDPTAIGDATQVGVGLGLYTSDAFAAGAASMPGPLTEVDYDWIFHTVLVLGPSFTATEDGTNILHNLWVEVDSKAMRKLKPNQVLGWIVEGAFLAGSGVVDIGISARHLFKLG